MGRFTPPDSSITCERSPDGGFVRIHLLRIRTKPFTNEHSELIKHVTRCQRTVTFKHSEGWDEIADRRPKRLPILEPAQSRVSMYARRNLPRGVVSDILNKIGPIIGDGVHDTDLMLWYSGEKIVSAYEKLKELVDALAE